MYRIWNLLITENLRKRKKSLCLKNFRLLRQLLGDELLYELVNVQKIFLEKVNLLNIKIDSELIVELFNKKYLELVKYYNEYFMKNNIKVVKLNNINEYILCVGNVRNLENSLKKIYFLDLNGISKRNIKIKNYFLSDAFDDRIVYMELLKNKDSKGYNLPYKRNIYICDFNFLDFNVININSNELYIFSEITYYRKLSKKLLYTLANISDYIFVLEASYKDNNVQLLDYAIEGGKNIYVTPGNIYQNNTYFSNYLIQQGAEIILSKNDVKKILQNY